MANALHRVSLAEWLDFFGFSSSPFSKWEAEEEARLAPERLSDQWVKPACFDRILGQASEPKTVLVFAPRGAGKTACRILVEYYCREGMGYGERAETGGLVLPILHIHHDEAIRQSQESEQPIDEYWHTREVLKQAVQVLTDLLRSNEALLSHIDAMPTGRRSDLRWFFLAYPPMFYEDQAFLQDRLGWSREPSSLGFLRHASQATLPSEDVQAALDARNATSPIDQLYHFVDLMCSDGAKGFGFEAVYVLVDGLDEFSYSADLTTEHAARLLTPLLSNLRLMNGPNLAFKCFLPAEIRSMIDSNRKIRRDRLGYETLTWSAADMEEILRRRLATYGPVRELDMLCLPELRGLERELIETSGGNPRRMIRLCDFMLQAHLERPLNEPPEAVGEIAYLFARADWQEAKQRIDGVTPAETTANAQPSVAQRHAGNRRQRSIPRRAQPVGKPLILGDAPAPTGGARQNLDAYPAPIALLYLDYLNRQGPFEKMGRMLDLFEATAAFVAVILLGQLRALAGDETASKLKSARLRLNRTSLGTWLTIWQRLPGSINTLKSNYYARRLQSVFNRYYDDLDALRVLRNKTRGHGATGNEQDAIEILEHYGPQVEAIIDAMGFLTSTSLIKVKHMQMHDRLFDHQVRIFRGSNPNFPWDSLQLAQPLESEKLLLMRDNKNLSLHPFIIAEFCQECRQEEIFTYQDLKGDEVHYLSYHTGHRLTSTDHLANVKQITGM